MAKLTDRTMLVHPETGQSVHLDKGAEVPAWVDGLVGPHLLDAADVPTERTSGVPPKGGPGSGRDAWAAYAAEHDVEVPADASREDIVAALDAADVPTE